MEVNIRPFLASDKPFLFSTMLRGLYHGNSFYNEIEQDAFYANYSNVVERLLERATVSVACLPDEPDVILGYAITTPGVLHYCFTKHAFRHQGIQRKLWADAKIKSCSHLTHSVMPIKLLKQWVFNPFLLP